MKDVAVFRQPRVQLGAGIAVAAVAGLVAWVLLRDNGGSPTKPQLAGATAMTRGALASLARSLGQPIFWLGPKRGMTYEVTEAGNGKIYVRYLPAGVDVGVTKPYLTVATYSFPGAYGVMRKQARAKGAVTATITGGGIAVLDNGYPQSVHVAYPRVAFQVEVYDPRPERAMHLVSAGQLASVGSLAVGAAQDRLIAKPKAATMADLESLAHRLGHPVYWAGPKPGYTHELSTTSNGSVFIRYLPFGVKVGDPTASYLTVATYPFPGAFAAVVKTARGADTIKLAHGGIAVVDPAYAKSIHLAYPGSDYQVEVYDPSPSAGRKLVASGAIAPVP